MEKKNIQMWIWALVVVVVIVALYFTLGNQQATNTVTTNEPESIQKDTTDQNNEATVAPIAISYADALVKYADRRIQLDPNCQAYPNTVTYKDNTGIMIDNRSDKTRTIKVGTTFTIKPWGFKIVVLPDTYLKSKTILIDCDGYQNVATVLVQE